MSGTPGEDRTTSHKHIDLTVKVRSICLERVRGIDPPTAILIFFQSIRITPNAGPPLVLLQVFTIHPDATSGPFPFDSTLPYKTKNTYKCRYFLFGAGKGNRTPIPSLARRSSTIEPYPLVAIYSKLQVLPEGKSFPLSIVAPLTFTLNLTKLRPKCKSFKIQILVA